MYTGIEFNGMHSFKDFGLTVSHRNIGYPSKIKRQERIPFSNEIHDFSSLYGGQEYEERILTYTFNIIGRNLNGYCNKFKETKILETAVTNWLMNPNGKVILKDDTIDNYYFMAELVVGPESDFKFIGSELTIEFIAYPFRISVLPEGHDIWDEIIFDLDVFQDVKFEIERLPFIPVEIGSVATLTAWASKFTGGKPIKRELVGQSYKILDVKEASSSESKRTYKLEGLSDWVVEQDIVQAQGEGHEITLYNPGTPSVTPIITTTYPTSIVFGNTVYNAWEGSGTSERFLLKSGENKLKLYTFEPATIEFEFYKELI